MLYFVQPVDGGPVKIGHSRNIRARISGLESYYGKRLALLATMPGGRYEELVVHTRFAHLRLGNTEQFRPASDLMEFIGKPLLAASCPDSVRPITALLAPVPINKDVLHTCRIAAAMKGVRVSQFISDALRPIVLRDKEKAIRREAAKQPKRKPKS